MPDFVRVKVKDTGHELSLRQSVVDANPDAYEKASGDAVDVSGAPLPPKHKSAAKSATNQREN